MNPLNQQPNNQPHNHAYGRICDGCAKQRLENFQQQVNWKMVEPGDLIQAKIRPVSGLDRHEWCWFEVMEVRVKRGYIMATLLSSPAVFLDYIPGESYRVPIETICNHDKGNIHGN